MNSKFADTIQKFIAYKNSLGYPYEESSRILNCFDRFCFSEYPDKSILDKNNTKELPYIDFGKNPSVLTFTCSKEKLIQEDFLL